MLFGIYGTHCVGKTTYLETVECPHIRKVYGDVLSVNYENIPEFPESKYYRQLEGKKVLIQHAVSDVRTLWVIEGMRFWGSMLQYVRPWVDNMGGGLFMLVITTTGELMGKLLRERAVINNKAYRDDYWTPEKLSYEAERRAINACRKHLKPHEWHHVRFEGDFDAWTTLATRLINTFVEDRRLWYDRKPLLGRGVA